VSPSEESQLLDEVFHDGDDCGESLWNGRFLKEKFLPDQKDKMPETLAATLEKLDMFDEFHVHVGKDDEKVNASTYPQPIIPIHGVVHSGNFQVDGFSVAYLYHCPLNNRITKSLCVPMLSYIYDFTKMIWERTRDLMPSEARDIPSNHCSQHFYYSIFKGGLNKHRYVKKVREHKIHAWYTDCVSNI
jgi:hypothetical protein